MSTENGRIVNGLNVDDFHALIGAVGEDAGNAATSWGVETRWMGGAHTQSTVLDMKMGGETVARGFTIDIDEPEEFGGKNEYANPQDYLLSAVNACILTPFAAQCALRGINLSKLSMKTEGDIDLRGFFGMSEEVAPGYEALSYVIEVEGDADHETFEEVAAAVRATSPNFSNMARAITMNAALKVV